ncbi:MAG TPA: hypothetical protein VD735_01500, partial [Candidatus Saccharimonadales bacterium]|nr:hypothetical protein [Candidatus Saccharimonadales bacterium]
MHPEQPSPLLTQLRRQPLPRLIFAALAVFLIPLCIWLSIGSNNPPHRTTGDQPSARQSSPGGGNTQNAPPQSDKTDNVPSDTAAKPTGNKSAPADKST